MAVVFCVRGDSLNARYSSLGKTPVTIAPVPANAPVVAASAISGVLGGSVIRHDVGGLAIQYLEWAGRTNIPQKAFSTLLRCTFTQNTSLIGLFSWSSGAQGTIYRVTLYYNAGTLNFRYYDEASNIDLNISGAWTPTVDTIYDIVVQWDGLTTANGAKVYVDNVLIVQGTAGSASVADMRLTTSTLFLGSSAYDVQNTRIKVNEFVIFDTVINVGSVTLESGSGALNGASRTSFVSANSFDGQSNSDPGATNVRSATGYTINGLSYTGSAVIPSPNDVRYNTQVDATIGNMVIPTISQVKTGVTFDSNNTLTGTYTGSDRWSDPGLANVKTGISYLADASTLTGTYTGADRWSDPGAGNVLLGISYLANASTLTGTLNVPAPASGSAGTVDLNYLLEVIRYSLAQANTTTASPIDLSNGMTKRVQHISKINPLLIPVQPSLYPFVTCYVTGKSIEEKSMSKNMLGAKRKAVVDVEIVGAVWNNNIQTIVADPADLDCHSLMENIEYTLRAYDNLAGSVTWQFGDSVKYYDSIKEDTHLRAGVMTLKATLYY